MSEEVRINNLEREKSELQAKLSALQVKHTAALATNQTLQKQAEGMTALQERIAALEPFEKQVGDLTAKTRSLEAARAYDKIADELKVKPEFRDDVFKLADLKIDGEVDEKAVRDHFTKFLAEKKHYTVGGDKEPTTLSKGDGSSRGGESPAVGAGDAKTRVTRDQLNDPDWTGANRALLSDASKYEIA
jgi:hypothetical protein